MYYYEQLKNDENMLLCLGMNQLGERKKSIKENNIIFYQIN